MKIKNSIHYKIMSVAVIISALVMGTILFHTLLFVKPESNEETVFLLQQNVEGKALEINQFLDSNLSVFRTFSIMPEFKATNARAIEPLIEEINESMKLTTQEISFIGKNGFCWINSDITKSLVRYNEYKQAYTSNREFIFSAPRANDNNQDVLLMYYPVKGYNEEKNALICSVIPVYHFKKILDSTRLFNGRTWIMNRDGTFITIDPDYIISEVLSSDTLDTIDLKSIEHSTVRDVDGIRGSCKLFITPVDTYDDWLVMTAVENRLIDANINRIILTYICVLIFLLILIIILGRYLSTYVLSPVKALQNCMKNVEEGNLNSYYDNKTDIHNEVDDLGNSFNVMLTSINMLIRQIFDEEKHRKDVEVRMLNEQIKPHFLYNTLDNIRFLAKREHAPEVASAIENLSDYFRLSLNNGKELVTIEEELKHTKSYLNMQKLRFNDNLNYFIECDESTKKKIVPKIILQPIVENCIKHGNPNKDKNLILFLSVKEEGYLKITVEDNGIGMPKSKVTSIMANIENDEGHSYGLKNINYRLKKMYGDRFHMKIRSIEKLGTTVTITIDKEEDPCTES